MELGIYTFGEVTHDWASGKQLNASDRLRDLIEEIELAEQVGLDVFAVGEHHRPDYAVSAPAVVLAAGAARTTNIRLSSAVNVLSSAFTVGSLPHSAVMHSIELYGTQVAPAVREELARRAQAA